MYKVRADYWKSQDRKYCDFCKCWIADNKPSVEFHEKGRRHKENVAKRLRAIQKKSRRDEKESLRMDAALHRMETAAMEAYRKDVASNADLTSIAINKKVQNDNLTISSGKAWQETKSASGKTYYWNATTNETVWEPPAEGYLSAAEQQVEVNKATKTQMKAILKHQKLQEKLRTQEEKKEEQEEKARLAREKLKERRVEDIPLVIPAPIIPAGKSTPYGQWKTVKMNTPTVDLQLPQVEDFFIPVVTEPEPEPVLKEFKEKKIESLGSGSVGFKKRKIGTAAKRNTRQRLDDEENV